MTARALIITVILAASAALPIGAAPVRHRPADAMAGRADRVAVTPQGTHLLGNPTARVRLTEYISYTCSHCAHFHEEATAPLLTGFIAPGKAAVEVVPYIRNPVDLAAALLVDCGGPSRFVRLHDTLLDSQVQWMGRIAGLSDAQRARWDAGPVGSRLRAIAGDLGFYAIAADNGIDRVRADRCLGDAAAAQRLAALTQAAATAGVEGTPGFAINGVVLTGTYDWAMLAPQLQARF